MPHCQGFGNLKCGGSTAGKIIWLITVSAQGTQNVKPIGGLHLWSPRFHSVLYTGKFVCRTLTPPYLHQPIGAQLSDYGHFAIL